MCGLLQQSSCHEKARSLSGVEQEREMVEN